MSGRLRVVFMGTPEFAVQSLEQLGEYSDIVAVYTQPDKPVGRGQKLQESPVKKRAVQLGLPVFQPKKVSAPEPFEKLAELKPDVIVVVAYGQLLKQNVLDLAPLGCVNVHSSLLPRWRGAAPMQRAILAGDSKTGVTTMAISLELDAGDIYLQEEIPIGPETTAKDVHDELAAAGARLLKPTLAGLRDGTLKARAQNTDEVTYAHKLTKDMEWLSPATHTARELDRQVRALNPWPGTSVYVESVGRLKIRKARPSGTGGEGKGRILERDGGICLGTGAGALELLEVQWEGKRPVDGKGFLNGLKGRGLALPLQIAEDRGGEHTGDGEAQGKGKKTSDL